MRILILTTAYLPQIGGSELAIKNITDRLPNIDFDLITARFAKNSLSYEKIGNVDVYRVGGKASLFNFLLPKNFFSLAVFFQARYLIRKNGPYDLIHAYQVSQAAGGGWLLKLRYPNIYFLVTVQEGKRLDKQPMLLRFFRYLILKKADAITTISSYLEKYIRSFNLNVPITIIPNGVDTSLFKPTPSGLKEQMALGDKKIIITASRLVEKNGVGDLIKAISLLTPDLPVHLLIIGTGVLKDELELLVKGLNLESRVTFLGHKEYATLPEYLSIADVFVRPSYSEGLGNAFLEAMACGVPIVGTQVGGIVDFLVDEKTGLFCEPGNAESIATAVRRILMDNLLVEQLTVNAHKLVSESFGWESIAERFRKIYEKQ